MTAALARHLSGHGYEVLVVTNRHPLELSSEAVVDGINVHRIAFPAPKWSPRGVVSYARQRREVTETLKRLPPPELIHVHCVSSQTPSLLSFARQRHIPVIVSTHGETEMDATAIYQRSRWMRHVLRSATQHACALTACSQWTAERAAAIAPAFAHATVIPNGIDSRQWDVGLPPDAPVIGAWGRHVPQKGFDTLLRAFARLRDNHPSAKLLLGGDGPERPALERLAGDGVAFLGQLDRVGVKLLLSQVKVVAVPSRVEPFGIVAVEALAAGRALVCSNVGGLDEATGGTGVTVPAEDVVAWEAALGAALTAPIDTRAARHRAAQLDWDRVFGSWDALYRQAVCSSSSQAR